jgi:enoyl-CoA hydratase/carnithine racemase
VPTRYHLADHVATLTLDRPDAFNAFDIPLLESFSEAIERLENDDDAWVGVVTGEGKAFSAGADLKTTIPAILKETRTEPALPPTIMRGQTASKPLIAAVNGVALGGGFEVVLACDLRIASDKARFGSPEVALGLIPGWGATQRLPRQAPWAVAARIVLTGEPLSAAEALAVGLINAVVPADDLMDEAYALARKVCSCGPLAVRAAKQAMLAAFEEPLARGLEIEDEIFKSLGDTRDLQEGISAFFEKRPPQFKGQ